MAKITTYPLDFVDYNAADAETYFATRTSGVYENIDFPITVTGQDNSVTIGEGLAWIRNIKFAGKSVAMKSPTTLDLGVTANVSPRIDAIVLQFNADKNATELIVKKGAESAQPQAPAVVRNEGVYELHLYHIRREPTDATVKQSAITDLRRNPDFCGIMMDELSQVDRTLTKDGFAADAGVVGSLINSIKDFIIEEGTKGRWEYVKLKNGIAICWGFTYDEGNVTHAWGSNFTLVTNAVDYPFTFFEQPLEFVGMRQGGGGYWIASETQNTTSKSAKYNITRSTQATSYSSWRLNILVIGRWK